VGLAFERFIVRPVYGQHLKQILITMGGMIIGEELIKVIWGPQQIPLPLPEGMRGSLLVGDAAIEKYRLMAVVVGLVVFGAAGLDAGAHQDRPADPRRRAGPRDGRVAGLPHPPPVCGVFVVGSALAGLGGVMWGLYQQSVVPQMGAQVNVLIFIVIIIGGLGSTGGALIGALLVGLMANYTGFLAPKVALFSNIALMVAILLWRRRVCIPVAKPQGVYPVPTAEGGGDPEQHERCMLNDFSPTTMPRSRWCWRCCCWPAAGPGVRAVPLSGRQGAERGGQGAGLHRAGGQLRPAAGLHRHRQLCAHHVLWHWCLWHCHCHHAHGPHLGGAGRGLGARWLCRCCWRWRWGCSRCGCGPSSLP
jgi:hypothetical protein